VDWDINPEGVQSVLQNTQTAAEPFDTVVKAYGDDLTNIMNGLNYDVFMVVATAVGEYSAHWAPTLEAAAKQVGASLTGAMDATKAYMNGQAEMAANAQRNAAAGFTPPIPGSQPPRPGGKAVAI
jgi:hypothetical protein